MFARCLVVLCVSATLVRAQTTTSSTAEWLRRYQAAPADVRAVGAIDAAQARKDIAALTGVDVKIRAAFLLEAAHDFYRAGRYDEAHALFEDGCKIARSAPAGTPFDRAWQAAAIAIAEAASAGPDLNSMAVVDAMRKMQQRAGEVVDVYPLVRDPTWTKLDEHLAHAADRVSAPDAALARAVRQEQIVWNDQYLLGLSMTPLRGDATGNQAYNRQLTDQAMQAAVKALTVAAVFPEVRAEATLRLGALRASAGDHAGALQILEPFSIDETQPDGRWLSYLAHLFRARSLAALGQLSRAQESLSAAEALQPRASSARLLRRAIIALAARGTGSDRDDTLLIATPENIGDDPWLLYRYGDYRKIDTLLATMREALR